ncbi:NADPH2 dehydrogenase [Exophiala aquamarina CBS 119918]|uniref:NADPH2 dehydrogenase n=1 Tax=Exophiala aquamarina CBS 119918 TaxID=1182545 RepID=A0A072PCZ9_9EURO|nr:NADPH2 dehydrogenase [Exophiala aquamarina CBS 119918]KEF57711.1 NADPH2 dehydrogenase [Exophiala aquamarina CBS 119918]
MARDRLFLPLKLGDVELSHRIVMAPLTRFRADDDHVPIADVKEYYAQRASTPGTLLIAEATLISPRASGMANVPGIWNSSQIAAWKTVTDAVHAKKCFIFLQLWALGRRAEPEALKGEEGGPYPIVSSSTVSVEEGGPLPHALTAEEIQQYVKDYASAAKNAIVAGFDGVEIHGANGYLVDQFLQESINQRTDNYGGSIENRARFGREVVQAIIAAVGNDSKKVAIRLSPWFEFTNNANSTSPDPIPQFSYMVSELKKLDLAYLHLVESRYDGDVGTAEYDTLTRRNDPLIELWGTQAPIILAGGFTPETAKKITEERHPHRNVCVAFGRFYISTPDLPYRVCKGISLNPYIRHTFYTKMSPTGYTDYSYSTEYLAVNPENGAIPSA